VALKAQIDRVGGAEPIRRAFDEDRSMETCAAQWASGVFERGSRKVPLIDEDQVRGGPLQTRPGLGQIRVAGDAQAPPVSHPVSLSAWWDRGSTNTLRRVMFHHVLMVAALQWMNREIRGTSNRT